MNQTFCAVKKVVSLIHRDLWVWLVDHDFHRKQIGGQSTKILLDLYKEKSSRSSEKKSNLKHTNRVPAPQSTLRLESVYTPRMNTSEWRRGWDPGGTNTWHCQKFTPLIFLPTSPKRTYSPLPGYLCIGEKSNEAFQILPDRTLALIWH